MAGPITLILLVAAGDAASPRTRAMAKATRDALGGAPVEAVETRSPPSDEDAVTIERAAHATAVAEVVWAGAAHQRVTLRLHMAHSGRWIERSFGFSSTDAPAEQGRTLGFAVASMFPEDIAGPAPGPAEGSPGSDVAGPPAKPPAIAPAPAGDRPSSPSADPRPAQVAPPPARSDRAAPSPPSAAPSAGATGEPEPSAPPEKPPVPTPTGGAAGAKAPASDEPAPQVLSAAASREAPKAAPPTLVALQLLALAAGGDAGGVGGGGAVEWFPVHLLGLRIGSGARASALDAAQANALVLLASGGVELEPWRATRSRPLERSLRADYVLSHLSVTHFDGDDPSPSTQGRWLSGVAGALDVGWLFGGTVDAVAGIGLQDDFGATPIKDKGTLVVTIPSLRLTGEGGLRVRF